MRHSSLAFMAFALMGNLARADYYDAKLFELGKPEAPLYFQRTDISEGTDGIGHHRSEITDVEGKVVMTEEATFRGPEILSQKMEQRQTGEAYELLREGTKISFRTTTLADGKQEEKTKDLPENFLTGPVTQNFLRANWADLTKGETLEVNFGIFEIARTVGFDLKKTQESELGSVVRMKPGSLVFSMFVDPIYMTFEPKQRRMVRFRGRTPLKKLVNGKYKNFDAEIEYEWHDGSRPATNLAK